MLLCKGVFFILNKWWNVEAFNVDMCLSKVNFLSKMEA